MSETELHKPEAEEQAQEKPVADWPSPGRKLKKVREELGLSHSRVADALHLTTHYVKALENDEFDKLPGKTFVKGYFRAYAKLIDVDVDDVIRCYEQYVSALEETEETEAEVIRAKKAYDQNLRWMACAAAIIVVVVGVSWWLAHAGQEDAAVAASAVSAIAETPAVEQEAAVTAEVRMAGLEKGNQPAAGADAAALPRDAGVVAPAGDVADAALPVDLGTPVEEDEPLAEDAVTVADVPNGEEAESGLPDFTVTELENSRVVQLESDGEDLLEVHFSGASWIEVDNGDNTRLYNDMLDSGDDLTIRGKAPFNILIGDANVVDVTFNSQSVDLSSRTRTDNSARIILEPETR